ncbi:serine hydrolase [soil metagenome]
MIRIHLILLLSAIVLLTSCQPKHEQLREDIVKTLSGEPGEFAVAFMDLTTGETILINEKKSFHAASTMKTPVMIEVFKQAKEGKFSLKDSVVVRNEFRSIVDGSPYSLTDTDDSEPDLYKKIGGKVPIADLVYRMITSSSNLATNILIEMVEAKKTGQTMRDFGANDMKVLRGVEDSKAFKAGLINTVTAYDLMLIFEKIATKKAVDDESSSQMIAILQAQKFNDIIPAKLPKDVKVAHKTGWITGVHHDSAIVYLPNGKYYVLILLSKDLKDEKRGVETLTNVSRMIYDFENLNRK